jgi:hypothetical protein
VISVGTSWMLGSTRRGMISSALRHPIWPSAGAAWLQADHPVVWPAGRAAADVHERHGQARDERGYAIVSGGGRTAHQADGNWPQPIILPTDRESLLPRVLSSVAIDSTGLRSWTCGARLIPSDQDGDSDVARESGTRH